MERKAWSKAGVRLLTLEQVGQELGVSVVTLRRWIHQGRLRARMIGGDKLGYRVHRDDLRAFEDSYRQTAGHE